MAACGDTVLADFASFLFPRSSSSSRIERRFRDYFGDHDLLFKEWVFRPCRLLGTENVGQ
jgi:hypothetical protein